MQLLRRHWPLALVLGAGAVLRVGATIAYRPALLFPDSWGYLVAAHGPGLITFTPLRPSGYPAILKVLSVVGDGLLATAVVQHIAGLVIAVLVYATLTSLGVRRSWATAAAALVALDAWAVTLEEFVLADMPFAFALALAMWASLAPKRRRGAALALAGFALAAATILKPSGLFAAAAWLIWLFATKPRLRPAAAGVAALAVPLLLYAGVHAHKTGTFGMTQSDGVFLYGRIGSIATCKGFRVDPAARGLCPGPRGPVDREPYWYIFSGKSPLHTQLGGLTSDAHQAKRVNSIAGHFARQVIQARPGAYLNLVARDTGRFLRPGPRAPWPESITTSFPRKRRPTPWIDRRPPGVRILGDLQPRASAPGGALRSYASVFHTCRPLIALSILLSLATLIMAVKRPDPRSGPVFLSLGMALFILLGTAATAGFAPRYVVPLVAEFAVAGTLSAESLASATRGWRSRRASPLSNREADRS